jgi:hypothetical protein
MAVTKIIPIRTTISNSVDYICNPNKTDDRLLVHSENCFPHTAGLEFKHYLSQTQAGGNTIGRHLIQSFAPGEVTPDVAHEIGKKLADEILKGQYAYVMATHVDCGHVHNHFVWCAANIATHKKYRSNKNTYHEIRNISDKLCKEYELSVIQPKEYKTYGKNYASYNPEKTSNSWRSKLKSAIDNLIPTSNDFEDLLKQLQSQGYEIKRGKHISLKAKGQERFTRLKSLGFGYTEEEIIARILKKREIEKEPNIKTTQSNIRQLIDIAGNPKFAESRGLEQWARIQNLQNSAKAFNLMMEYGGMETFLKLLHDCRSDIDTIENGIAANNERIKSFNDLRKNIITYNKTKSIYKQYKETTIFKERFRKKHEDEISDHENAKYNISQFPKPTPKIKELDDRLARLKIANINNRKGLAPKKAELNELKKVHSYLFHLRLTHQLPLQEKEKTRSRNFDIGR